MDLYLMLNIANIVIFSLLIMLLVYLKYKKLNRLSTKTFKYVKELGLNAIYMMFDLYLEERMDPKSFIERMLRVLFVSMQINNSLTGREKHYLTKEKIREIFYPILLASMYRIRSQQDKELLLKGMF